MDYISTTELRTESMRLQDSLAKGKSTYLVHRSKIIGVIEPYTNGSIITTQEALDKLSKAFKTGKNYSYKKRKELYLKHLEEKYGKRIS